MKDFFAKLLSSDGSVSMVRFLSLISVIIAGGVAFYGLAKGRDLSGIAQICAVFVGSAFAGKVFQKQVEAKK